MRCFICDGCSRLFFVAAAAPSGKLPVVPPAANVFTASNLAAKVVVAPICIVHDPIRYAACVRRQLSK